MTSSRLRTSLTAVLAFTVAATLIVGSAFAADGDNGKSKRRGPYVDGKGPRSRVPRGLFTNRSRNLLWQLHAS